MVKKTNSSHLFHNRMYFNFCIQRGTLAHSQIRILFLVQNLLILPLPFLCPHMLNEPVQSSDVHRLSWYELFHLQTHAEQAEVRTGRCFPPLFGAELIELLAGGLQQPQPSQVPAGGGKDNTVRSASRLSSSCAPARRARTLLSC